MTVQNRRFLILLGVLVGIALLVGIGYFVREANLARQIAEARERGLAAHAEGRYEASTLRDLNIAARDRSDGEVILALADTRRHIPVENGKHIIDAIGFAQAAADRLPGDQRPLELLLELYTYTGFVAELLDVSEKLLATNPTHKEALQARVRALRTKGDTELALAAAHRLAAAYPDEVTSHLFVLDLMRQQGGPVEDRVAYADAQVDRRPDDPNFLLLQARVAGSAGELERASEIVRRVAQMRLDSAGALAEAVRLMDLLRMGEEAIAMLERQAQNPDLADAAALLVAERGWKAGLYDEARRAVSRLIENPAEATDDALGLAALFSQVGITDIPGNPAQTLRERTTPTAMAWVLLLDARAALAKGDFDDARSKLNRLIEGQRIADLALWTRGQLELARAEPGRAVESFDAASRLEPRWLELRLLHIGALTEVGRLAEAVEEAQRTALMFPRRLEPYSALARATTLLIEAGQASNHQITTILELLDRLAEESVNPSQIAAMRARVLAASGRAEDAGRTIAALLDSGAQITPDSLAEILSVARRINDTQLVARLESGLADGPVTPSIVFDRAFAAARDGRILEGAAILRDAAAKAPAGERLTYDRMLASYHEQNGNPEALPIRKRLAEDNPGALSVQIDLLRCELAWAEHDTISAALSRVKSLAGADSTIWRIGEARRLLTFERTEANAANAASLLNDVIRAEPENLQALLLLAEANMSLGDPAAAMTMLGRAVDAAPREPVLYPRLVRMLQESGAASEAERRLRDFAGVTDLSLDLRRQRAQLLVFQAMWPEAEADLRVIAAEGNWRDRLAYAEFLAARGRFGEAAPIYDAVASDPNAETPALVAAAEFFAQSGAEDRADQLIQRVRDSASGPTGQLISAGFEERRGRLEHAEQIFRQVASTGSDPNLWAELAAFYLRQGRMDDAADAVQSGLQLESAHPTLTSLDRLLKAADGSADGAELTGLDPASMELYRAQELRPSDDGDPQPFLDRLVAVTRKHPTNLTAWTVLVREALTFGQAELAVSAAQSAVTAIPSDPQAARLAAETLALTGQSTEAIAAARVWRDRSLRDPFEADMFIASLQVSAGRPADALQALLPHRDRLLAAPAQHTEQLALYASLLAGAGRVDAAREILQAYSSGESSARAQIFIAIARGLLGAPAELRDWLSSAADHLDLANSEHALQLAQVWFELAGSSAGQPADYERVIELASALTTDPDRGVAAHGLLATSYDQTGKLAEAEAEYRIVLQTSPDQPIILNNLAYLLLKRGAPGDESARLAQQAVSLAQRQNMPMNVQVSMMDTLGAAHLHAGRADRAAETYREALNLVPDDPELVSGLALALTKLDAQAHEEEIKTLISRFDRLARTRNVPAAAQERMNTVRAGASGG